MRRYVAVLLLLGLSSSLALTGLWGSGALVASDKRSPEKAGPIDWLADIVRLEGRSLESERKIAAELSSGGGGGSSLTAPSPHVLVDGWTRFAGSNPASEDYDFSAVGDVTFTTLVKVGEAGMPGGVSMDFVLVPLGVSRMPPLPSPAIFVDDVFFAPIDPGGVRLFYFSFTIPNIGLYFPPGSCVDWFAAADFDASNNADADIDGLPDCCIEGPPARFIDAGSPSVDALGASVIDFFNPGNAPLRVIQPHPPFPAPKAIGLKFGEDGTTRPWNFVLQ